MLKHGTAYVVKGMAEYEAKVKEQAARSLKRKAQALGYDLVPQSAPSPANYIRHGQKWNKEPRTE